MSEKRGQTITSADGGPVPGPDVTTPASLSAGRPADAHAVSWLLCGAAIFYAVLVFAHLMVLQGPPRSVMTAMAAGSAAILGGAGAWTHRRRLRGAPPPPAIEVFAVVPMVNCLTHIAVTGELHQTTTLMLALVAVGAAVTSARIAALVGGLGCAGWVAAVAGLPTLRTPELRHYATQLAMAAVLAGLLHGALTRRQGRLAAARDELAVVAQRFVSMFEASPVGIGLADEQGRFVAVNPALCRLFDRPALDLLGRSSLELTHPDDRSGHGKSGQLISDSEDGAARIEKRYVRPDGTIRWAWLTLSHVTATRGTSAEGGVGRSPQDRPWTLGHVQDVTDRHHVQQALRDSERNLAAVTAVARRIRTGEDARTSIITAVQQLAAADMVVLIEPAPARAGAPAPRRSGPDRSRTTAGGGLHGDPSATGARLGATAELAGPESDTEPDELVITAAAGQDLVGVRIPLSTTSVTGQVYRTASTVFLADPADDPLVSPALLALSQARSMMWQPVITNGRVTGVLAATWKDRVPSSSDQRARAVTLLADETALALQHEGLMNRMEQMAHTDTLTGLPNRRAWQAALPRLLVEARRAGRPVIVAVADLDHFKRYNDTYGHPAGDALLARTAAAFTGALREHDLVARWGGEEFAIALTDCPAERAAVVLDRLRTATPDGQTCSIGYATWDTVESDDQLLSRADAALYLAKESGRDTMNYARSS